MSSPRCSKSYLDLFRLYAVIKCSVRRGFIASRIERELSIKYTSSVIFSLGGIS